MWPFYLQTTLYDDWTVLALSSCRHTSYTAALHRYLLTSGKYAQGEGRWTFTFAVDEGVCHSASWMGHGESVMSENMNTADTNSECFTLFNYTSSSVPGILCAFEICFKKLINLFFSGIVKTSWPLRFLHFWSRGAILL